jgi:hypothetical protein
LLPAQELNLPQDAATKAEAALKKSLAAGKTTADQFNAAMVALVTALRSLEMAMERLEKDFTKKTVDAVVAGVDSCADARLAAYKILMTLAMTLTV